MLVSRLCGLRGAHPPGRSLKGVHAMKTRALGWIVLNSRTSAHAPVPGRSSDGMDSSRDLNGIVCQSRLASKSPLEGGAR